MDDDAKDKSKPSPTLVQLGDQYGAEMGVYGDVYAQYFKSLTSHGVPYDLASKIVRDFAWASQIQRLYPTFPPPTAPMG